MEDLHREYGCHIITTGGVPSLMTINYLVTSMKEFSIDLNQTFYVITFSDFDPAGYNIAETFIEHLRLSGLKNFHLFEQWGTGKKARPWLELSIPSHFDKPLKDFWYLLPKVTWDDPGTKNWIKLTGGLDGSNWKPGQKTHGLESDEFDLELIKKLFAKTLQPLLKTPSDDVKQINAMQELRQELEQMAIVKFLDGLLNPPPSNSYFEFNPLSQNYSLTLNPQQFQQLNSKAKEQKKTVEELINHWLEMGK